MANFENKIIKKKNLGKDALLKVSQNEINKLIVVEISSKDGKLVVQKSFQDTLAGARSAEAFQKKIKSLKDLRKYFGLN